MERDFEAREILFTDEIREQRLNEIAQKQDELEQLWKKNSAPAATILRVKKNYLNLYKD
jgi:outer membrane protein